jgi:hypothetical protein
MTTKQKLGPLAGGDLMSAWRRAGKSDSERKAEDKEAKLARLRELADEARKIEQELDADDGQ